MRVKRVFMATMFCCYISISRLMQIRSVDHLCWKIVSCYWFWCMCFVDEVFTSLGMFLASHFLSLESSFGLWELFTPFFLPVWMWRLTDCIVQGLSSSLSSCWQQEVENFKKVHLISREQFDCLTPEPPVDPNQEVPPGPPRPQQSKDMRPHTWSESLFVIRQNFFLVVALNFICLQSQQMLWRTNSLVPPSLLQ